MPASTIQPAWQTYADELVMLGHGLALWQPAPLYNYDKIKIGDVGYVRQGRFHLLFSTGMPLGKRRLGEDVPLTFVPLDPGPVVSDQPRLPGALHADYIESKGVSLDASYNVIDIGTRFQFQTSSRKGAILVTKHKTFREDAERLGRFKEYMLQHHRSWVDHANKLGHMVELQDVILVTGYDMTLDFAMLAFSSNSGQIDIEFSASVPTVGAASAAVWGTWRTSMSVHHNCGPQRQYPDAASHLLEDKSHSSDVSSEYNQCVFLRGYRIRKRVGLIPKVIRAAAGPHDLGSGHRFDEAGVQADCHSNVSDSDPEIIAVSDSRFVDPLTPIFDYLFDNSEAQMAIVHDYDLFDILKCYPAIPRKDMNNLVSGLTPRMINVGAYGFASFYPMHAPIYDNPKSRQSASRAMQTVANDTFRLEDKGAQIPSLKIACKLGMQIIQAVQISKRLTAGLQYLAQIVPESLVSIAELMKGRWDVVPPALKVQLDEFEEILQDVLRTVTRQGFSSTKVAGLNAGIRDFDILVLAKRLSDMRSSIIFTWGIDSLKALPNITRTDHSNYPGADMRMGLGSLVFVPDDPDARIRTRTRDDAYVLPIIGRRRVAKRPHTAS